MNRKRKYQLILVILIAIVIFNCAIIIHSMMTEVHNNSYNTTTIASNVNGTVYKIEAGNMSSNETVGLIIGVHPREHEIHECINNTIHNLTQQTGNDTLSKKFVIYYIKTNDNLTTRTDTRAAGEELANKYVVPKIVKDKPFIVVDVHEISPYYEYSNFVFSLSQKNDKLDSYISKICEDVDLVEFNFTEGTSPEKVTKPIAKKGVNTLLVETYMDDNIDQKNKTALKLIRCLDELQA